MKNVAVSVILQISDDGGIHLPPEIRAALGLEAGAFVQVDLAKGPPVSLTLERGAGAFRPTVHRADVQGVLDGARSRGLRSTSVGLLSGLPPLSPDEYERRLTQALAEKFARCA